MSSFSIVRNPYGQVEVTLKGLQNKEIDGVGKFNGSATISVGNTGPESNQTVLQIGQTDDQDVLLISVDDDLDNIEFYGKNIGAEFKNDTDKTYNVQWNASDSVLDSTKDKGSFIINTNEGSEKNMFLLGDAISNIDIDSKTSADNIIFDSGKGNTFIASENSSTFLNATKTSDGVNLFAGNGQNTIFSDGVKGLFVGGRGSDSMTTGNNAKNNILLGMEGNDSFFDYGNANLILGGEGLDSALANGSNSLFNLGNDEDYVFKVGGSNNQLFAAEKYTRDDGTVYNYNDSLNDYFKNNDVDINNILDRSTMGQKTSEAALKANQLVAQLKGLKSTLSNADVYNSLNRISQDKTFAQQAPKENQTFTDLSDSQKQKLVNFIMTSSNVSEMNAAKMLVELNENDLKTLINQLGI